jgi:hypothetical protein
VLQIGSAQTTSADADGYRPNGGDVLVARF